MILSMTGFGHAKVDINGKTVRVEIKSLNARSTEIRCKVPSCYRDREMDIRKKLTDTLLRGKLDIVISIDGFSGDDAVFINADAFKKYYQELKKLKDELNIIDGDIMQAVLRVPNVIGQNDILADDEEWHKVDGCIDEALMDITKFRMVEGKTLELDMHHRVEHIAALLDKIIPYEGVRLERIKERLKKNMDEFAQNHQVDLNRYEQEIIYFLEKLDITEEKVRLRQHCDYFISELTNDDDQTGRRLAFIGQEIGREINTIGSKAQDSNIQQIVVQMKDELEKVKEQLANIL